MSRAIAALLLTVAVWSCVPDDGPGATGVPGSVSTLPPPIASDPPVRPSPSLEVPPPID